MRGVLVWGCLALASVFGATTAARNNQLDEPRGVLPAIARAPANTRAWTNPYEGDPLAVQAGEKLYRRHCAQCHGEDARGTRRAANLCSPVVENATPGELAWFLRNGNRARGMSSWSGFPIERRWQIVTYVKSLR